jgi:hypothetical protein
LVPVHDVELQPQVCVVVLQVGVVPLHCVLEVHCTHACEVVSQ